ncbi:prepilin peptidase [Actinophytocola sp. KF-1]
MNATHELVWAAIGVGAGATLAPTAAWLAEVRHRRLYRLLISATTGIAFAALAGKYPLTPEQLALSVFAAVGVLLATIDIVARQLPRTLVWPTCAAVATLLLIEGLSNGPSAHHLLRAATGAIALVTGYLIMAVASRGGLGAGDVRTALLVGAVLAWQGWPVLFAGTALGFLATGVIAAAWTSRRWEQTAIPHGPGMLVGAFAVLLM